jgi:F-type H+-transporting ATPase subunit b
MDSILNSFHVELGLFIAQIVNFAIVFAVLYYFVIKPLMKVMKERSEKIEESLKQADQVAKKLTETEEAYDKKISEARIEAGRIIEEATEKALAKKDAIVNKSKEEIGVIINKEKESIRLQKEKTMKEIKTELTDIVMLALEKVLEKRLDQKEDRELIKKTLNK